MVYPTDIPSRRTPQVDIIANTVDLIEDHLQEIGHRIWGFVIYRCTYENDDEWAEFMRRLRFRTEKSLGIYNGLDMLASLDMKVFEDRSLFDGASTSTIRQHFQEWTIDAPHEEQSTDSWDSQRYIYCVQVDALALHSIVYDAPAPPERDGTDKGFVNVISAGWSPNSRTEEWDPIEGCTQHDVGWMRVAYQYLMVDMYHYLRDDGWQQEYRRPPRVASS